MDEANDASVPGGKPRTGSGHDRGGRAGEKSIMNNPRRFSDEKIRSLESIFELETRLEPGKKARVARELGLQPRQVAIWFQNKRARWKSKRLEHDYAALGADYADLASRLESLKREKHALISQLARLKALIRKETTSIDIADQSGGKIDETTVLKMESLAPSLSEDDESSAKLADRYIGLRREKDENGLRHQEDSQNRLVMSSRDMTESLMPSSRHGPGFGIDYPDDLLDPGSPAQWWDFWA